MLQVQTSSRFLFNRISSPPVRTGKSLSMLHEPQAIKIAPCDQKNPIVEVAFFLEKKSSIFEIKSKKLIKHKFKKKPAKTKIKKTVHSIVTQ